jgi:hypothetical protein
VTAFDGAALIRQALAAAAERGETISVADAIRAVEAIRSEAPEVIDRDMLGEVEQLPEWEIAKEIKLFAEAIETWEEEARLDAGRADVPLAPGSRRRVHPRRAAALARRARRIERGMEIEREIDERVAAQVEVETRRLRERLALAKGRAAGSLPAVAPALPSAEGERELPAASGGDGELPRALPAARPDQRSLEAGWRGSPGRGIRAGWR